MRYARVFGFFAALAVAATLLGPAMCAEKVREYRVGEKVADFALPDLNGKTISLSDFKKKVVLVVFISHW